MNLDDVERVEQKVFRELQLDFGPIASSLREVMKRVTEMYLGIEKAELGGDPNLLEQYGAKLRDGGQWYFSYKRECPGLTLTGNMGQLVKKQSIGKRKIRPKQFNQRFRIVSYVTDWLIFTGRTRVKWQEVTAQWNRENPHDQYENPSSLERLYNKARKQDDIAMQLLMLKELQSLIQAYKQAHDELKEYSSHYPLTAWLYNVFVTGKGAGQINPWTRKTKDEEK